MSACPTCSTANPDGARFCASCGSPLAPLVSREVRKTVTILFADVTGSTALGEQLDPESLRAIMGRYFTMMKAVIESHGGTVEKFIGDAVMAVFGIPLVHEDDALRAVRAAAAIKDQLEALNSELLESRGIAIRFRTGLNTGEVVAGDPASGQTLVTGDTVNTAARLEQAAPPGEILLGAVTWSLVRDAVEVEPTEPIAAKGKAAPVLAYRLISVRPGAAGRSRRPDAPLVGRERELERLEQAFGQAVADRSCGLFTLLGTAGVGKSRLVAEFLAGLGERATVVRGHCLSYGEGITYWPIGEIVRSAAGISDADSAEAARVKVRTLLGAEREADILAARVCSAIGLSDEAAPQEEIFWAIRRLLEHLARERPLVVVVEDIHWAEATLLDLLEHIADWSRDAALLLLCPARPELLDGRTAWGGGKLNATTVLLEALAPDATGRLIAALPGGSALPDPVVERITAAAEGNPLYVEELLAMLVDDGLLVEQPDASWAASPDIAEVRVPATISALLAARLEQLEPAERAVAERASVVGRVFDQAAVSELSDEPLRPAVGRSLLALVKKELVRPERSELAVGDAFRFRHILIRDAAYGALPKADRAALHERFADWLERTSGERLGELEEIVGHHLAEAHRYRTELGESGPELERLGERAGERLATAGERAYERGDATAATSLLQRAVAQMPTTTTATLQAKVKLTQALYDVGSLTEASSLATETVAVAHSINDRAAEALARCVRLDVRSRASEVTFASPTTKEELEIIRSLLGDDSDPATQCLFWMVVSLYHWEGGDFESSARAVEASATHAERSGSRRLIEGIALQEAIASLSGPEPVAVAAAQFEALTAAADVSRITKGASLDRLAILRAMEGRFTEARAQVEEARRIFEELGSRTGLAELLIDAAWVERLADDFDAEVGLLREAAEYSETIGAAGFIPFVAARLALAWARLGNVDEARKSLAVAEPDPSWLNVMICHLAAARMLAAEDRLQDALDRITAADALSAKSAAFVNLRTEVQYELAVIALEAGKRTLARSAAETGLTLATAKGNVAMEDRLSALLVDIAMTES